MLAASKLRHDRTALKRPSDVRLDGTTTSGLGPAHVRSHRQVPHWHCHTREDVDRVVSFFVLIARALVHAGSKLFRHIDSPEDTLIDCLSRGRCCCCCSFNCPTQTTSSSKSGFGQPQEATTDKDWSARHPQNEHKGAMPGLRHSS